MANLVVTNVDDLSPILEGATFQDDIVTFAGADTFAAGTILARDTVSDKLVLYVKGGVSQGNGIPSAILTADLVAAGAGDENTRVATSGKFRKEKLIIDADGDDSNIDDVVKDLLRQIGLVPINVQELNSQDNQ